jgi:pilus assembly protein Flp/PilA
MRLSIAKLVSDDRGTSAVEYGLIISLIVLAMIGALKEFASSSIAMWTDVSEQVENSRQK